MIRKYFLDVILAMICVGVGFSIGSFSQVENEADKNKQKLTSYVRCVQVVQKRMKQQTSIINDLDVCYNFIILENR